MSSKIDFLLLAALPLVIAAVGFAQASGAQKASEHHEDHMKKRFDPAHSASFDDPKRDEWQKPDEVISVLDLKPGMRVADIGAGTGYFTVRLARHAAKPNVYAVDIEPKMLKHIQERMRTEHLDNVSTVLAGENSPNFPELMDLVIIVNTYHHVPDRSTYFAALLPKLAPGGRIAIIDFRPDADGGPPAQYRFSAQQIQKEMAEAGYRLRNQHHFLPRQTFQVFEANPTKQRSTEKRR